MSCEDMCNLLGQDARITGASTSADWLGAGLEERAGMCIGGMTLAKELVVARGRRQPTERRKSNCRASRMRGTSARPAPTAQRNGRFGVSWMFVIGFDRGAFGYAGPLLRIR